MAKASSSASAATATVVAKVPIEHDGKRYAAGESLDVTQEQFAQLAEVGAIEQPAAAAAE